MRFALLVALGALLAGGTPAVAQITVTPVRDLAFGPVIVGVPTTIPFHQQIMEDERFTGGDVHTGVVSDWLAEQTAAAADAGLATSADGATAPRRNGRGPAPAELTSMEIE